jgi:uncharacterized protein YbaR (Trm112 family)
MIDPDFLKILCCPESHQGLALADASLVASLNERIAARQLTNRAHKPVETKIDAGLIRTDGRLLYPIRDGIPILLVDEGIPLDVCESAPSPP